MRVSVVRALVTLIWMTACLPLHSQTMTPEPAWDRALALQTIANKDTRAILKPLYQMARSGRNEELLESLTSITQDPSIPDPTRDYLVYGFALGLADLDAYTASPAVLDFLSAYRVRTLVAHDDHPRMAVPLFNVKAVTAGVRNHWDRQQASVRAETLFEESPDQWVSSYLAANPVERRGFEDALDFASHGQLRELGWSAIDLLDESPELTLLAARTGMDSGDLELLHQAVSRGSGPDLSNILKAASLKLSNEECIQLLDHALRTGSVTKAALAIAHLAPAQLDEPAVREALFDMLEDKDLGASAALVLGASPDAEIQSRLTAIASGKEGLATQRASLALKSIGGSREEEL